MRWTTKARIQNAIAMLPDHVSYELYYRAQRTCGALRRPVPISRLSAGLATWNRASDSGMDPRGQVFFEVGTGRSPVVPIALWLLGASRTVTVDLNPYLKPALIRDHLDYLAAHVEEVEDLFGEGLDEGRLAKLVDLARRSSATPTQVLDLCCIDYRAPADAAATQMADSSIDIHTSYTTFEHIPRPVLADILVEGLRIVRPGGRFIHRVDYTDHFSHSDPNISAINFLRFSQSQWDRIAGNRYMYMNRLRHDDFRALFTEVGHRLLDVQPEVDVDLWRMLDAGGFVADDAFRDKTVECLSTTAAWFVTAPPEAVS